MLFFLYSKGSLSLFDIRLNFSAVQKDIEFCVQAPRSLHIPPFSGWGGWSSKANEMWAEVIKNRKRPTERAKGQQRKQRKGGDKPAEEKR